MTSRNTLSLLATALALATTGAQATSSFATSAAVGSQIGNVSAFAVVCTTPTCSSTVFDTSPAAVDGSYGPDPAFSASAWAQSADELTLRARASLTVTGLPFAGIDDHIWFANTLAQVSTQMVFDAPVGIAPGATSDLQLRYRFDGSGSSSFSPNVLASKIVGATVSAFTNSGPVQGLPCTPDGTGFCDVTIPGLLDDETFSYEALLQVALRVTASPGSLASYSAAMDYDYSNTFVLESVSVTDGSGATLGGWSLFLQGSSTPIFSSPVPEPGAGALLLAGLLLVLRKARPAAG